MPGLGNILRNIVNYHAKIRPDMVRQFERVKDGPKPTAVMFSCMDSRVIMTRMLQAGVGDMFLVRNAGAMVPHADTVTYDSVTTEPGALELGCVINGIRHVMVCGHSDCKAMNLLYSLREDIENKDGTPLRLWLKRHGRRSMDKYNEWAVKRNDVPLEFRGETDDQVLQAYIDPEDRFQEADKFSQINTLQQVENVSSHPILSDKLRAGEVQISALWFDIHDGRFHMFSRKRKQFLPIDEQNYMHFLKDGERS